MVLYCYLDAVTDGVNGANDLTCEVLCTGWGAAQATIRNGARWGTYNAFLKRTLSRESVHILTHAVVQKVAIVRGIKLSLSFSTQPMATAYIQIKSHRLKPD